MSSASDQSASSIRLPSILAIGFSGHRKLPDEEKSRKAIRGVLTDWKANFPGIVYGVSSVAAGGDLLFAESCIELELPVRVLLPVPADQFREDFDAESWARAERVMASALSVEVKGVSTEPTERYYESGIETVHESQMLIALWDGEGSRGMGGTADMVDFAKGQGRPVIWIHSETGVVQQPDDALGLLPKFAHDPELEFLNNLPDASAQPPVATPLGLAQAWFTKVDQNASRVAPQFRRLAAIPILCTAIAALLSSTVVTSEKSVIWLWSGTAFAAMATILPSAMRLSRRQVAWTRMRAAAEVSRSCLALWQTPALYEVVGPEIVPELSGALASLNFLKMSGRSARPASVAEFKRIYRGERVNDQIAYFSSHADRAARAVRWYRVVVWSSTSLAVGMNLWRLASAHGVIAALQGDWKNTLAIGATLCFQIATVAGALLVVNDYQRRRDRYRELHRMLIKWDKQLELSQTWSTALRIMSMVEKGLLSELIEWRSLIRNRKLPQK